MLGNASSVVGTAVITSALGFVFWWFAARFFSPDAVGLATASISAMALLGNISVMGLGTLLMGELSRHADHARSLVTTAVIVTGGIGSVLGIALAICAPHVAANFELLATSPISVMMFSFGVSLATTGLLLDQICIGLDRGYLQLGRNAVLATAKLGAIVAAGMILSHGNGTVIYATWVFGSLLSLAVPLRAAVRHRGLLRDYQPRWSMLRGLRGTALGHHSLNLALSSPYLILPILAATLLTATASAYFSIALLVAGILFIVPVALSTVLYAEGSRAPELLGTRAHFSLRLSCAASLCATIVVIPGAVPILGVFGSSYAEQAVWSFRVVGMAVFPLIIKNHYASILRVQRHLTRAGIVLTLGGALEVAMAAIGAHVGGLTGLGLGWTIAVCIEAICMMHTVYRVAISHRD